MSNVYETVIVSFDPASSRNLGWALANISTDLKEKTTKLSIAAGTFVLPSQADSWRNLGNIRLLTDDFLQKQEPDLVVVEKTSSFAAGFITGQVSQCMGSILASCCLHCDTVEFVLPSHVKKVVSGNGRAKKNEMKKAVLTILQSLGIENAKFDSEHAYDAIANIFCYLIDAGKLVNPITKEKDDGA